MKQERRWCPEWDAVMSEMPVRLEGVKAFRRSKEWVRVTNGHRACSGPEPGAADDKVHSCFSEFLEAHENEAEDDAAPDPPSVVVSDAVDGTPEQGFAFAV